MRTLYITVFPSYNWIHFHCKECRYIPTFVVEFSVDASHVQLARLVVGCPRHTSHAVRKYIQLYDLANGNWVVVKLLFKVVNYRVLKLLRSNWRLFCLAVYSYRFTYLTATVYLLIMPTTTTTTVLLNCDRPMWYMTIYMTMQLDRLAMKQLLCVHRHEHCLSDN